jgi:hypothetical protein
MGILQRLFGRPTGNKSHAPQAIPWKPVRSSWVHSVAWVPRSSRLVGSESLGTLYVRYKDKGGSVTVTVAYARPVPLTFYASFLAARSKGKFVHAFLYDADYDTVSV